MTKNKKQDLHCMICQKVYYRKEQIWLGLEDYLQCNLGKPTSGIYHRQCIQKYLETYVGFMPRQDRQKLQSELEKQLEREEENDKGEKT